MPAVVHLEMGGLRRIMVTGVSFVIAAVIGYVCGAVPFGFLYVKFTQHKDLREIGSGRTGGTNSLRAAGWKVGVITSLSDVFKGFMGVWLTQLLVGGLVTEAVLPWVSVTAGIMAVVGHNWSAFLSWKRNEVGRITFIGWRGGAGTGPNIGWSMAIWPVMFPIGFLVMLGLLLLVGMASVASMAMAAIIPIVFGVRYFMGIDGTPAYMIAGLFTAVIVLWALRPNIKRLLEGNERVVGPRAKRMMKKAAQSQQQS